MATWKQIKEFIDNKVEEEGESWLDNKLYIECVEADLQSSFDTIEDGEGWEYISPAWRHGVLTTTFKDKKIITINVNY